MQASGDGASSKNKHYTPCEKKLFMGILKKYGHIIEVKKSNASTLREKDVAWAEICNAYNLSALVSQKRTVHQLKKLWTNLKQCQRDTLTKEKQARYATGGGPEIPLTQIDPDVAIVAPNLMKTAPVLFSSNMTEDDMAVRREQILDDETFTNILGDSSNFITDEVFTEESNNPTDNLECPAQDNNAIILTDSDVQNREGSFTKENESHLKPKKRSAPAMNFEEPLKKRTNTGKSSAVINTHDREVELKVERIRRIIEHEEKMNRLAYEHMVLKNGLEIRAATAAAELAELQLQKAREKETNKY